MGLFGPIIKMHTHWRERSHPIFRAEIRRPLPRPSFDIDRFEPTTWFGRVLRGVVVVLAIVVVAPVAGMVQALGCGAVFLVVIFPFIPWLWRVPTVIVSAASLAREIENRRWDTLRCTSYSVREIVEALLAAGTYRMQEMWAYVTRVRLAMAVLVLAMVALSTLLTLEKGEPFFILDWMALLLSLAYLLAEPLLDITIDGVLGVLTATFTRLQVTAMVAALVVRVLLWGLQVLSLLVILPLAAELLAPGQVEVLPILVVTGPAYALLFDFSAEATIAMVVGLLALRLAGMHGLLWWAVQRAESIAW